MENSSLRKLGLWRIITSSILVAFGNKKAS